MTTTPEEYQAKAAEALVQLADAKTEAGRIYRIGSGADQ